MFPINLALESGKLVEMILILGAYASLKHEPNHLELPCPEMEKGGQPNDQMQPNFRWVRLDRICIQSELQPGRQWHHPPCVYYWDGVQCMLKNIFSMNQLSSKPSTYLTFTISLPLKTIPFFRFCKQYMCYDFVVYITYIIINIFCLHDTVII